MTDYRSPAATTSMWAKDDPTAADYDPARVSKTTTTTTTTSTAGGRYNAPSNTASTVGSTNTAAGDATGSDRVVKTGQYGTGLEPSAAYPTPIPVVGSTYQNRVAGAPGAAGPAPAYNAGPLHTQQPASGDGLAVVSGVGGPLGGSVVMGGQCECLRNGGTCGHGAGQCMCRGCSTAATTVNPGVNVGVSTVQYTAPVGTTGLGGGVGEAGTGMAGVVNPTNTIGQPVHARAQNCECNKNGGTCNCPVGACGCTNCKAYRQSTQATGASTTTITTSTGVYRPSDYTSGKPVSGSTV